MSHLESQLLEQLSAGPLSGGRYTFQSQVLGKEYTYCQLKPPEQPSETLYLFHGGNADDRQFYETGLLGLIQGELGELFRKRRIQVVLPFIGKSFLHQHPLEKQRSYSNCFFDELVPVVEANTRTAPSTRWVGGLSMGGQAALNVFMRKPGFFQGVAVHFPTLVCFDYTQADEVAAFSKRCSVTDPYLKILVDEFQNEFVDRQDYLSHDPIALFRKMSAEERSVLAKKHIYFDVGGLDEFGLFEGCEAFHRELQNEGIAHRFESLPDGKHDGPFVFQQFPKLLSYLFS
ncbi:MAG: alpha/beta hydrolase [Bdellovibrionia bacterium]